MKIKSYDIISHSNLLCINEINAFTKYTVINNMHQLNILKCENYENCYLESRCLSVVPGGVDKSPSALKIVQINNMILYFVNTPNGSMHQLII